MSQMSLKDLEITQLKDANKELKDRITTKESEDATKEIRKLKEKVTKFEERVIGRIPLEGAKHFIWDAVIKEMPSLENNFFMVDEHKQVAMDASRRCKAMQESIEQSPREETQKVIFVINSASREELISLGITNRISILVATRRMETKHNML